jgi:hypothetical protein
MENSAGKGSIEVFSAFEKNKDVNMAEGFA